MEVEFLKDTNAEEKLSKAIDNLPKGTSNVPTLAVPKPLDTSEIDKKYSLSWFEVAWYWFKPKVGIIAELIGTFVPQAKIFSVVQKLFIPVETENISKGNTMEDLKGFLVPFILRWVMKIGGGFLLSVGISEGSVSEIIMAIVGIVIGLIMSVVNTKTAVNMQPPK